MNAVADIDLGSAEPAAALHFCYIKVREEWPEAVMVGADGRTFAKPEGQRTFAGLSRVFFYPSRDALRASRLFPAEQAGMQADLADGRLRLMGSFEAAKLVGHLSDLPCWERRSSGLLRAIDAS